MKTFYKSLIALALLSGILLVGVKVVQAAGIEKPTFLISHENLCKNNGGDWGNNTCTYPPGSAGHTSLGLCSSTQNLIVIYTITYTPDKQGMRFSRGVAKPDRGGAFSTHCEDIPFPAGYGKCGNEASHTEDEAVVSTCHGTAVTFAAGACTGKCTVGPAVVNGAKNKFSQLDGTIIGQAYVKMRNPGGGSYKICMTGVGTLYQWISGEWRAIPTSTVGGVSCAWSSGDGNFVLVGN